MKLFSLLSVLVSTATAAYKATEQLAKTLEHFGNQDREAYSAMYPDGFALDWGDFDFEFAFMKEPKVVGKDGFTMGLYHDKLLELKIYDMQFKSYEDPEDSNAALFDSTLHLKDEAGQRIRAKWICKYAINPETGKFTSASHHWYKIEKIDAASVMHRVFKGYLKGSVDYFMDNLAPDYCGHHDFGGNTDRGYSGTYCGRKGAMEVVVAQAKAWGVETNQDGTANLQVKLENLSNDGKTALFDFRGPLKIKSSGSRYYEVFQLVYEVNDMGLITSHKGIRLSSFNLDSIAKEVEKEL